MPESSDEVLTLKRQLLTQSRNARYEKQSVTEIPASPVWLFGTFIQDVVFIALRRCAVA
jgi:hypothetical protein